MARQGGLPQENDGAQVVLAERKHFCTEMSQFSPARPVSEAAQGQCHGVGQVRIFFDILIFDQLPALGDDWTSGHIGR